MDRSSAVKGNEVMIHATVRKNLKAVTLSERSQTPKVIHCIIYFYGMSRKVTSIEMESRFVVARG